MDKNELTTKEKVDKAIRFIKSVNSQHIFALAYSGGKDSVVLDYLVKEAGIKVDKFHNCTTIDPEGTLAFCARNGAKIIRPRYSFLDLVEKRGFPTMFRRFCCTELKEKYYADHLFMGVRKAESVRRDRCYSELESIRYYTKKIYSIAYYPLLYMTDDDIASIINEHSLECHPLYYDSTGRFCVERRLGCIGCPLQGDRGRKDFLSYPKLLLQILRRGVLFHQKHGRTAYDAALNLVYNLWYSNGKYKKFEQTYKGLFDTDPWEMLDNYYFINEELVMRNLPKPKF